ncbi:hypothetical protein [Nocardia callitridis]|uniref:3-hydroxyacyl-CoA dehydrogenase n=1 Tax=Nocardia callitridis TaxID=648753 RepID=A0ABP9K4H9_9NOCA
MAETQLLVLHPGRKQIIAMSTDGADIRVFLDGTDQVPDGIAVDQARGHLYWTNMGVPDRPGGDGYYTRNGSLERVDLDGTGRRTILPSGAFTTGKQLTADFATGSLYWCDREGMRVLRADLDGSRLEPLVVTATGDCAAQVIENHCVGIAVDPVARQLYWTQKGAPKAGRGRILRAGLDIPVGQSATDRKDIEILWADLPEPIDLELAPDASTLTWTDRGAEPEGNTLNRGRIHPGSTTPEILATGFRETIGLTTVDQRTYYVTDLHGGVYAVDSATSEKRLLADLGPGATGIALAELG